MKLVIRGETFRTAEETAPTAFLQHRYAVHRLFEHRHELIIQVTFEFFEGEIEGNTVLPPRNRVRFEGADQQATGVFTVVGAVIVIAHHRQIAGQIVEFFGMRVIMLTGMQGHADPGHASRFRDPTVRRN